MNIFQLITQKKKTSFLVILFLVSLASIIYLGFVTKNPQPSVSPLTLTQISPTTSTFKSVWSAEPILFQLNAPINFDTIKFTVTPNVQTRLLTEKERPNSFSILPLTGWKEKQQYRITISKQLSSVSGEQLAKDATFTFTRELPQPGDPEYPQEFKENTH